jgi:tripartite ATP-independent transporter DctP family solute receptor
LILTETGCRACLGTPRPAALRQQRASALPFSLQETTHETSDAQDPRRRRGDFRLRRGHRAGPRTIKFATQNPKGHPLVMGMEKFAEIVAGQVGRQDQGQPVPRRRAGRRRARVSALQGGTVEMASLNSGILASQVKDFEVYDFPFMFASSKEADAVVDGPFGKKMHAKLEPKGLVGLAYWELGFRNITNSKRAINKVKTPAGLKLRVIPNAINVDWVKALGANPTPLAFPEVYAALEQKAIDGQENPLTVIAANKFFEVQKFATLTNHQYNPQSVLISKKFWDTLSADEKKIICRTPRWSPPPTSASRPAPRPAPHWTP